MTQKILDIIPPGEPVVKPPVKPSFRPSFRPRTNLPRSNRKIFLLVFPLVFIAGLIVYFTLAGSARVEIWPKLETKTLETKAEIAATLLETERQVAAEFSSSGKKTIERKAEGTIKVYNNYSSSQTLVANTRFQAPADKFQPALSGSEKPFFKTQNKTVVPAKSSLEVKVVADSPGEKYNIKPSKFSIPGLAGTAQYTLIYGESSEEFSGGQRKEVPQVTGEDILTAKNGLSQKTEEENLAELQGKAASGLVFLPDTFKTEILEAGSLAGPGLELAKFNYQLKSKSQALASAQKDLEDFAEQFVLSQISEDLKLNEQNIKIEYSVDSSNYQSGKVVLSLKIQFQTYPAIINEVWLKDQLAGKKTEAARVFLENQDSVNKIKIRFWPFWLTNVPKDSQKIKIELKFN